MIFLIIFFTVLLVPTTLIVLKIIGRWKVLEKAKEDGWKSLIPFLNTYTLCKITGLNEYWVLVIVGGYLLSFIPFVLLIAVTLHVYFKIILSISLCKSFGKETDFAVGLVLLPAIFYMILGLDKSKYQRKTPTKDIIFDNINKKQNKQCHNCQKQASDDSIFCTNCGSRL